MEETEEMKVKDLLKKLKKIDPELEIFLRIPNQCGNISELEKVDSDTYGFFGKEIPCIILDK